MPGGSSLRRSAFFDGRPWTAQGADLSVLYDEDMETEQLETLVNSQRTYFRSGETLDVKFRRRQLARLEAAIYAWQDRIEQALYEDLGKDSTESWMSEIGMVLSEIRYQRRHLEEFAREKCVMTPLANFYSRSSIVQMPYGNVLVMSPWNYPFLLSMAPLAEAMAAGNTVLLKPGSASAHNSMVMAKMLESTFPSCYIAVVQGGHQENSQLLAQRFDYIFFTGSRRVGQVVLEAAAKYVTPVTLELGGKSPVIVDETADIALSARRIIWGKALNAGQTCVAPDYVLVQENVKEALVRQLRHEASIQVNQTAKIIDQKAFARLSSLTDAEEKLGRPIYTKGRQDPRIAMTIIDDVQWTDPVMQAEIFGPILPVLSYRDWESEVVDKMQDLPHPLACYLFSRDAGHIRWMKEKMNFGGGCVNDTVIQLANDRMPFGGVGDSGMGQYHGRYGFETFTHPKSVVEKGLWIDVPVRYRPFTKQADRLIRLLMK